MSLYLDKLTIPSVVAEAAIAEACWFYDCGPRDILGLDKTAWIASARHYAMWLLRQHTDANGLPLYSYPEIGRVLNRTHGAVMNGVARHEARMADLAEAA